MHSGVHDVGWRCLQGIGLFFALCAVQGPAVAAEDFSVESERNGEHVEIRARALIAASPREIWQVISDYASLERFIPGMAQSRVLLREGNRARVAQRGDLSFLFISYPFEVELDVVEEPFERIVSHALRGNVRRMDGRYELRPDLSRAGVWLLYSGTIEPESDVPLVIGMIALRAAVRDQFAAMVQEIERRRDRYREEK